MTTSYTTTIAAVAEQLRQGSLTIPDLLWRCRRRIADLNGQLNAVITLAPDAEAQAEQREEELRTGKDRGLLHGIPLLVKDNIDVAGMPSTVASPIFASALPAAADAAVIAGLREAGAIILGKTNMDEFAAHVSGRTSCWGADGQSLAHVAQLLARGLFQRQQECALPRWERILAARYGCPPPGAVFLDCVRAGDCSPCGASIHVRPAWTCPASLPARPGT